jgi:protein-S-isoprenylcysteine O-methyltransferase Ste14
MCERASTMTNTQSQNGPADDHTEQYLSAMAALAVGAAFFALWFWLLPGWLGFRVEAGGAARWRWLAAIPSVLGFAIAHSLHLGLRIVGLYRYVRNPMYLGFAVGWIGLWIVFGHAYPALIASVITVALGMHLFVMLYEEPTLGKKFSADYEEYRHNVHRWWPRLRAWHKSDSTASCRRPWGWQVGELCGLQHFKCFLRNL